MTIFSGAELETSIGDIRLLNHPFYRRWEAGELSHVELQHYAEQYRYFEQMLPLYLTRLANELPDGLARESVLMNLSDEVSPPSHLELFEQFAKFYDADREAASPAMTGLVDTYFAVLEQGCAAALAGLWAYESQGAEIADSKAEGLATHFGASEEALAFWLAHGSVEGDHAAWTLDALNALDPDSNEVRNSVRRIAEAWWAFLDERELVAS